MRNRILPVLALLLLPACAQDDPVVARSAPDAQMARVPGLGFYVARHDDTNSRGKYLYPDAAQFGFTWEQAAAYAQRFSYKGTKGHLADFASLEQEENVILTQLELTDLFTDWCWIGLVQQPDQTDPSLGWGWRAGGNLAYVNWNTYMEADEPDDLDATEDGDQDYGGVLIGGFGTLQWHTRWQDLGPSDRLECFIYEL